MKTIFILFLITISFISCKDGRVQEKLNTIVFYNGDILTMTGAEATYVEALVVKDGKITYTGDTENAMEIAGVGHKMEDLKGKTLLPGFIDGHAHFASFSGQAIGAQILPPPDAGAKDIPTLINILKELQKL